MGLFQTQSPDSSSRYTILQHSGCCLGKQNPGGGISRASVLCISSSQLRGGEEIVLCQGRPDNSQLRFGPVKVSKEGPGWGKALRNRPGSGCRLCPRPAGPPTLNSSKWGGRGSLLFWRYHKGPLELMIGKWSKLLTVWYDGRWVDG